jgi:diaminohydroxyphosphoribosylaminopyrimidine deaminase/5-amino-6-(5-phosphoribosylamino)uracil reductase
VIETTDGRVFEGATEPPGGRHAEVVALDATQATKGATVWVTLEPCAHHGRTGPCADALIAAGVARVVVGIEDPDPNVAGKGIARLRAAGVTVEVGDGAEMIAHDLRAYLTHRRLGRPFVTLKLAMTTDGRTTSEERWITGAEARSDGHRLRAENDAILVGANTVRVDNPRLTTRDAAGPDPLRIVLGHAAPDAAIRPCIEASGDLDGVLQDLASRGITSVLVEGGEATGRAFHEAGLVDEYVFYIANAQPESVTSLWGLDVAEATQIGNDVRVTLVPRPR